jgi:hypothetical protein
MDNDSTIYTIVCNICDSNLETTKLETDIETHSLTVYIKPCENCLDNAGMNGYDDGYHDGHNDRG